MSVPEWRCKVEKQEEYAEFYWCEEKEEKKLETEKVKTEKKKKAERIVNECFYKFRAERLKDIENRKEFLKITVYLRDIEADEEDKYDEDCSIKLSMKNLENGLIDLREYGIVFSDDNTRMKLKRKIESCYWRIPVKDEEDEEIKELNEEKFQEFLFGVYEYFNGDEKDNNNAGKKGNCWYMRVILFNNIAARFGYKENEIQDLRKRLKKEKLIIAEDKRYTKTVRYFEGKIPVRVIVFHGENLERTIKNLEQDIDEIGADKE